MAELGRNYETLNRRVVRIAILVAVMIALAGCRPITPNVYYAGHPTYQESGQSDREDAYSQGRPVYLNTNEPASEAESPSSPDVRRPDVQEFAEPGETLLKNTELAPTPTPDSELLVEEFELWWQERVRQPSSFPDSGYWLIDYESGGAREARGNFFGQGIEFLSAESMSLDLEDMEHLQDLDEILDYLETQFGYNKGVRFPAGEVLLQVSNPYDGDFVTAERMVSLDSDLDLQFSAARVFLRGGKWWVAVRAENSIVGNGHDEISGSVWLAVPIEEFLSIAQNGGATVTTVSARDVRPNAENAIIGVNLMQESLKAQLAESLTLGTEISLLELSGLVQNGTNLSDADVESLGYVYGESLDITSADIAKPYPDWTRCLNFS